MNASQTPSRGIPSAGSTLAGKYRLDHVLGQGGMGVVFAAFHLQLHERVAVKVLRPERANTRNLAERLVREARAAVRLKNEHVVRILDAGTLDDDQPFIVMEHLQGEDLSKVLERRGRLPVREAVDYLLQTCEAVAEAHSLGIVHRDLKPANLFLEQAADGPRIKVLDFGISRALNTGAYAEPGVTSTQSLLGSPAYASPEQLTTPELVDARTDIWALGVLAYELLAGKSPFAAASLALVCTRVLQEEPRSLHRLRNDVPPSLARVVARALKKRPEQRQSTVLELARGLAEFGSPAARASVAWIEALERRVVSEPPPSEARSVSHDAGSTTSTAASARLPLPARPPRRLALGVALMAAALAAALSYTALRFAEPNLGAAPPAASENRSAYRVPAPQPATVPQQSASSPRASAAPALSSLPFAPTTRRTSARPGTSALDPTAKPSPPPPLAPVPSASAVVDDLYLHRK